MDTDERARSKTGRPRLKNGKLKITSDAPAIAISATIGCSAASLLVTSSGRQTELEKGWRRVQESFTSKPANQTESMPFKILSS